MPQDHGNRRGAALNLEAGNDRRYRVYVLRLGNGDLYVGSTGKSIQQRYAEHCDRNRKKPARAVKRFGVVRLETRMGIRKSYASRSAAVGAERSLAVRLREGLAKAGKKIRVHQG